MTKTILYLLNGEVFVSLTGFHPVKADYDALPINMIKELNDTYFGDLPSLFPILERSMSLPFGSLHLQALIFSHNWACTVVCNTIISVTNIVHHTDFVFHCVNLEIIDQLQIPCLKWLQDVIL